MAVALEGSTRSIITATGSRRMHVPANRVVIWAAGCLLSAASAVVGPPAVATAARRAMEHLRAKGGDALVQAAVESTARGLGEIANPFKAWCSRLAPPVEGPNTIPGIVVMTAFGAPPAEVLAKATEGNRWPSRGLAVWHGGKFMSIGDWVMVATCAVVSGLYTPTGTRWWKPSWRATPG